MATKTVQDLALESTPAGGDHVIIDDGTTTRKATVASVVSAGVDLSAVAEDILPDTDDVRSLGSATKMWQDVYVGPGSLYVNGQKVLEDSAGTIIVSADVNQNLDIKTTGTGDIGLTTAVGGKVEVGGTLEIAAGKNVTSSDGNAISFTNGLDLNGEAITNVAAGSLDAAALTGTLPAISGASLTGISIPTLDAPSITGTLSVDSGGTVSHTISNWSDDVTYVVTPTNCTIGAINSSGVFVVTHTSGTPSYTIVATTDSLGLADSSVVTKNIVLSVAMTAPSLNAPADSDDATAVTYTISSIDSNATKVIFDAQSSNFTYGSVGSGSGSKVGNTVEITGWSGTSVTVTLTYTTVATYSNRAKVQSTADAYTDSAYSSTDSIIISSSSISATGGTIYTTGGYKYHKFTSTGTFTVTSGGDMDILLVAGGGGGGTESGYELGAGGGAGNIAYQSVRAVSAGTYTATVGSGGVGGKCDYTMATNGSNTTLFSIVAIGGGRGGTNSGISSNKQGADGGSGGGGSGGGNNGGSGTTSSSDGATRYGNSGGDDNGSACWRGSGGGGAGASGGAGGSGSGQGGNGLNTWSSWATATSSGDGGYFAGGGTSICYNTGGSQSGGSGGGGAGDSSSGSGATSIMQGDANTGGGGGGGFVKSCSGSTYNGGHGGTGIIIVRYAV